MTSRHLAMLAAAGMLLAGAAQGQEALLPVGGTRESIQLAQSFASAAEVRQFCRLQPDLDGANALLRRLSEQLRQMPTEQQTYVAGYVFARQEATMGRALDAEARAAECTSALTRLGRAEMRRSSQ
ncbi:hypothetical protein EOD42_09000 [Rhodovarius crocodyli]|uniref:TIGR02301 family protein n=1 Tax=Rhodovarius crocodyli TaxID=1979269 RepID=A0A437MJS1_9PROT|nr:hypothetical protein [Rhodovarius crocodyli]RVT97917.1 hypothetical protein EOD42_09000 [Rhodovarius crocodyli]